MITLTEPAAFCLSMLLRKEAAKPADERMAGVRLKVIGGGCAGMRYDMQLAAGPETGDLEVTASKVPLFIEPGSADYLKGVVVDYQEGNGQSSFKFINPNSQESCGCGKSFRPEGGCEPSGEPDGTCSPGHHP